MKFIEKESVSDQSLYGLMQESARVNASEESIKTLREFIARQDPKFVDAIQEAQKNISKAENDLLKIGNETQKINDEF
jgi:hypothetical protein